MPFYCFAQFLFIDPLGSLSNFSLIFFGTLHSDGYIFPFFLCFFLLVFSQLFVRPLQTDFLLFLHFLLLGMILIPVSSTMSQTSVHSSSGTLSIRGLKESDIILQLNNNIDQLETSFNLTELASVQYTLYESSKWQERFVFLSFYFYKMSFNS